MAPRPKRWLAVAAAAGVATALLALAAFRTSGPPKPPAILPPQQEVKLGDAGRLKLVAEDLKTARKRFILAVRSRPAISSMLPEAFAEANLDAVYDDVTGSFDRWWRSPERVTRQCMRELVDPTQLALACYACRLQDAQEELEGLWAAASRCTTSEAVAAIRRRLDRQLVASLLASPESLNESVNVVGRLGEPVCDAIEQGEDRAEILVEMKGIVAQNCDVLRAQLRVGRPLHTALSFNPPLVCSISVKARQDELDRLQCRIITISELIVTKRQVIALTQQFYGQVCSAEQMDSFYDGIVGPIDALTTIWNSRGTTGINDYLLKKYKEEVLTTEPWKQFFNGVEKAYSDSLTRILSRCFDEIRQSPNHYGKIEDWIQSMPPPNDPNGKLLRGEWLRTEVLMDAFDIGLFAVDAVLIVGGIMGAPLSGGWSLLATAVGVAHVLIDQLVRGFMRTDKHISKTRILLLSRLAVLRCLYGIDIQDMDIAGVGVPASALMSTPGGKTIEWDNQVLRESEKFIDLMLQKE